MKFSITFLAFFLFSDLAYSSCNFSTSKFQRELRDPQKIQWISVSIHNSRKWVRNSIAIFLSKSENIDAQYKKKMEATIHVRYPFGRCEYEAKVRQSGDWKDHIALGRNGGAIASLDIKLREGNILNAVHFKLLLPETRGGLNEILAVRILKEAGFIAPETFMVQGDIIGTEQLFLFQENAKKEMLEQNLRREGPIFEGDEELLWSFQNFMPLALEDVALSRLVNENWAEKGPTSLVISSISFNLLQDLYLDHAELISNYGNKFEFVLSSKSNELVHRAREFALLLSSMNGKHGLRPHNRKFYFNSFFQKFENIYYDGNTSFEKIPEKELLSQSSRDFLLGGIDRELIENLLKLIVNLSSNAEFVSDFRKRARFSDEEAREFLNASLPTVTENLKAISMLVDQSIQNKELQPGMHKRDQTDRYRKRMAAHGVETDFLVLDLDIDLTHVQEKFRVRLLQSDDSDKFLEISSFELSKLMSENRLRGRRTVLLPGHKKGLQRRAAGRNLLGGDFLASPSLLIDIDHAQQVIRIRQATPTDWVLFRGISADGWTIEFKGLPPETQHTSAQRFNEYGLTGCLTFFDSTFSDTSIQATGGQCEDSVNIVASSGELNGLSVSQAFSDAVDIDFSDITIDLLAISSAGNDCFDVSTGEFVIGTATLSNCGDKGFSVGEQSILSVADLNVSNATTGISSKDQSVSRVRSFLGIALVNCIEAAQKKQEFGGGTLIVDDFNCHGQVQVDPASTAVLSGVSQ